LEEDVKFSLEEKAIWLADWKKSGKNVWTYAREKGLIPQTFYNWVKLEAQKATGFVEIPLRKQQMVSQVQETILVEKGDIKIHIPLSVWLDYPGVILEGLKAAP
jgi:transposase-like protein